MRFAHCIMLCVACTLLPCTALTFSIEALAAQEAKAHSGNVTSQVQLGDHYYSQADFAEAMKWYRLAAAQGQYDARRRIADMYIRGEGTSKNVLKGYVLLRKLLNEYTLYPESQQSTERYVEEVATLLSPEQREEAETLILEMWDF